MRLRVLIAFTLITCLLLTSTGCGRNNDILEDYNYMTSAYVKYGDDNYEINKCIDEDTVIIVKNEKVDKVLKQANFASPTKVIELPPSDDELNLNERQKVAKMTWETTLEECSQYVNYLTKLGYEIEFQANTEAFIEIYMKNSGEQSDSNYKRIVITEDNLVEADVDSIFFKNINNYII